MDVIFNCPHCEQELSADVSGVGSEIECPSCGQSLVIPESQRTEPHIIDAMASSAAAKEEKHFKVPQHSDKSAPLITKPLKPMEAAAKEGIGIQVRTIRRSDCVEVGKDRFDEVVSEFLSKIGEDSIINLSPVVYTHMDLATRAWVTDYGVMVIYRSGAESKSTAKDKEAE